MASDLRTTLGPLALALVFACNAGSAQDDGFDFTAGTQGSGAATGTSGTSTGADSSAGDTVAPPATDSGSDTGADSGSGSSTTEDLPPAVPCTGVDVLFVVDNSEPMIEEQIRLRSSAVAFVQQLGTAIPTLTDDIQVGVITTDDDLLVQANAVDCGPYEGGNPWMLGSSKNLMTELDCALNVGVGGSPNERPMQMLAGAFADEQLEPGGPHNGFLREDALLVIVLVTNEEDEIEADTMWGSPGDPPQWSEQLAALKGGWANDIVVYSLVGLEEPNACAGPWDGTQGAQHAPRLIEFTEAFPLGAVGDVCEQEYASFLLGVVPGAAAACDGYIPP